MSEQVQGHVGKTALSTTLESNVLNMNENHGYGQVHTSYGHRLATHFSEHTFWLKTVLAPVLSFRSTRMTKTSPTSSTPPKG